MPGRIVFLGCSLSNEELSDWTSYVAGKVNLPYVNLSQSAGNNLLQIHLLEDYLLSDNYNSEDIFVWQFTSFTRTNFICSPNLLIDVSTGLSIVDAIDQGERVSKYDYVSVPNYFGNGLIAVLSNPNLAHYRELLDPFGLQHIEPVLLQRVLANIKLLLAAGHSVITILGWDAVIDSSFKKPFLRKLKEMGVYHVHHSTAQWCAEKNLEFRDDLHPMGESSRKWAQTNVLPILQKIVAGK